MNHEWLFWDNQDFMNPLGLGTKSFTPFTFKEH